MDFFAKATLFFNDQFTAGAAKAKGGFTSMANAASSLGQSNALLDTATKLSVVGNMTEPFRQKLSAALQGPSVLAEGLDSSFKNIQAVTRNSGDEMKALQGQLISIGSTSVAGLQGTVDTFYDIAGGVTNAAARMPTLQAALALSEAGQADLGASASGLINVMNAYSFSADKAMFAADVFTQTVGVGKGNMDEFVSAMSPLAGISNNLGVGFDQLGTALAFVNTKGGVTAAVAGTQLKAAMVALLNPNESMAKTLAKMGVESGTAAIKQWGLAGALNRVKTSLGGSDDAMAKVLGSSEALQASIALTRDDYDSFAESFNNGLNGATLDSQKVQLEAFHAKMAKLQSAQDAFRAKLGESSNQITGFFAEIQTGFLQMATPILSTPLGEALSPFIAGLGMAAEKTLALSGSAINTVSQLAMIASLARDAGGYTKLFGGMMTGLSGGFQMFTSGAARGIGVFGSGLASFNASVRNVGFLATFKNGLMGIGQGFAAVGKGILSALPKLGAWIVSVWSAVVAHIAVAWPIYAVILGVAALAAGVVLIIKNWKPIGAFFVGLWKGIASVLTNVWGGISGFFAGLWKNITGVFSNALSFIWKLFDNKAIQAAVIAFVPFLGIPLAIVKNWGAISSFMTSLWGGITTLFETGIAKVKTIFFGLWDAIKAPFSAVMSFMNKLFGGAAESGKASMDAFSTGINQGGGQVAAATGKAFQKPARLFPHSDAPEGPFSTLTASGNALMTTFATGIDSGSGSVTTSTSRAFDAPGKEIERSAAGMSLAAAFRGPSTTVPFPESTPDGKKTPGKKSSSEADSARQIVQHFHIEKDIVVQAENIRSVLDFVELLMNAAGVPA
jgi:TP901 family phage tail tape measure protein